MEWYFFCVERFETIFDGDMSFFPLPGDRGQGTTGGPAVEGNAAVFDDTLLAGRRHVVDVGRFHHVQITHLQSKVN